MRTCHGRFLAPYVLKLQVISGTIKLRKDHNIGKLVVSPVDIHLVDSGLYLILFYQDASLSPFFFVQDGCERVVCKCEVLTFFIKGG